MAINTKRRLDHICSNILKALQKKTDYHNPGPPSAPLNVSVFNVTNTSAILSWLPPEDDGGRDHSEIQYRVTATGKGYGAFWLH